MDRLLEFIAEETVRPVEEAVRAMAEEVALRHGAAAVLFYGSCLRDGADDDGLLDFYVLVERYGDCYDGWFQAAVNRLLPPNVFFLEIAWRGRRLRAKYAVISLAQFARGAAPRTIQPMIWARFCQPTRLVLARNDEARSAVIAALGQAVATMAGNCPDGDWVRGFQATYRCELRPEAGARARMIYERDAPRYDRLAALAPAGRNRYPWLLRRLVGRLLNAARLIKAIFTYDGALDYALWKIERHSGLRIPASPWQRRHPLLAAPVLAWRYYRLGGLR